VPVRPFGYAARSTQWRCRATLAAERSGASPPVSKQAAGVPSAWSKFFPQPPRDHADGATLDRRRRASRPVFREATSMTHIPHLPAHPAAPRVHDSNRSESEGGASPTLRLRRPLPQRGPEGPGSRKPQQRATSSKQRGKNRSPGRAGHAIVPEQPSSYAA